MSEIIEKKCNFIEKLLYVFEKIWKNCKKFNKKQKFWYNVKKNEKSEIKDRSVN